MRLSDLTIDVFQYSSNPGRIGILVDDGGADLSIILRLTREDAAQLATELASVAAGRLGTAADLGVERLP